MIIFHSMIFVQKKLYHSPHKKRNYYDIPQKMENLLWLPLPYINLRMFSEEQFDNFLISFHDKGSTKGFSLTATLVPSRTV